MREIAEVPLVAGIVGIQPADVRRTRAHARRVVRDAEMHRLEPLLDCAIASTLAMPSAVSISTSMPILCGSFVRVLDLREQRVDHVHVARHAHLGNEHRVDEPVPACSTTSTTSRYM